MLSVSLLLSREDWSPDMVAASFYEFIEPSTCDITTAQKHFWVSMILKDTRALMTSLYAIILDDIR